MGAPSISLRVNPAPTPYPILLLLLLLSLMMLSSLPLLLTRLQECFAVRADVDGMLDVARHTFLQSTDDIYQTADQISQEAGYHVKVRCSVIHRLGGWGFAKNTSMREVPASVSSPTLFSICPPGGYPHEILNHAVRKSRLFWRCFRAAAPQASRLRRAF